jgi:energy-coupling factor transport system ATP-binding protein
MHSHLYLEGTLGIIEIRGLSYSYPGAEQPVLRDVDLSIERGEFVLLTGPSGCGKTTLCRCLNGLIPHFYNGKLDGEIKVAGLSVPDTPTSKLAQHVGLIFQNPDNQIFALTVEKDIAFGLENLGYSREDMIKTIDWALKVTGIENLRDRAPHELSGGQKQRLAIASILAMKPEVIVLDEPTSFLDPVGAENILQIIDRLNKELNMTIVMIEHRLDLLAPYLDRIVILDEGRILHDGPPREIFAFEESKLVGIGVPVVTKLEYRLREAGIDLGETVLNAPEFIKALRTRLIQKRENSSPTAPFYRGVLEEEKAPDGEAIIEAKDLHFSYPNSVRALNRVSLRVMPGEFLAIMGENGAGKTTLVKHFNGLLRPNHGEVYLDGKNIAGMSVASLARKVGLVFQNPDDQLFSESVEEEIAFALRNFGFDKAIIEERTAWVLELLGLTRYRKASPFTLSGGERKRVALASVLAWDPEVLVLDEPTIGQDYAQKGRLKNFLTQLRTRGKTLIIVTHDVEFVAECKPRVILMAKGQITADGSAEKVLTELGSLKQASVNPPEIAKVFLQLSEFSLPRGIINVEDAYDLLTNRLGGNRD